MGNIVRRGIAAYQQTMQPKTPEPVPPGQVNTRILIDSRTGDHKLLKISQTPPVPPKDTKTRRVAKFLILIGSNQAAKILGELDPQQVEEISQEIATIQAIGPDEARLVLTEFKSLLSSPYSYSSEYSGGVEAARRILYAAYGPEKGEALLNKTVPESKENIFGFLEEFSPEQLVFLFKDESPATVALVLARLSPKTTAETLKKLSPAFKLETLKRIAHQSEVAPEVLENVARAMRERVRHLGSSDSQDIAIDGMQTLAAILKQGDYSFGDRIIGELETEDPGMSKELKDQIYTLDDVLLVHDRSLAEKLKNMPEQAIAVLLKGRSGEFCEKILSNVSAGRRKLIHEEGEILGAVPRRDCDAAASDFMTWFRLARESGELILTSDEDWVV
jgi:flagellar motor switch protein FliG